MGISPFIRDLRTKIGNDLLHVPSVAVLAFDPDGRILLVREADTGLWMTVGGAIEPGELPAAAAIRECREETGLTIEPLELVGVFGGPEFRCTYPNGDEVAYTSIAFAARVTGGRPAPDGIETQAVAWFTAAEAAELQLTTLSRELVRHAMGWAATRPGQRRAWFAPPTRSTEARPPGR